MIIRVFVQNEAGSLEKHYHDEKRLVWQRTVTVSRPYPFPYGFILETSADDDCNVDCFVITHVPLRTGQVVECEVVGLMEQFEDGQVDHNVLARLRGSQSTADDDVQTTLQQFVTNVFAHVPNKHIEVGRFLGPEEAEAHITAHTDR